MVHWGQLPPETPRTRHTRPSPCMRLAVPGGGMGLGAAATTRKATAAASRASLAAYVPIEPTHPPLE